jgi:hypothetical protein
VPTISYFTTTDTYENTYKPVIQEVVDDMKSKGYCHDNYTLLYKIDTSPAENAVLWRISSHNKYSRNIEEILIRKLKKMYCKKFVEGEEFTSLLEASELV